MLRFERQSVVALGSYKASIVLRMRIKTGGRNSSDKSWIFYLFPENSITVHPAS